MSDFSRLINTTLENHIREVEVDVLRNRKVTALLEASGRFSTGWDGTECTWPVKYRRAIPRGFGMGDTVDFASKDRHKKAKLDWRGTIVGDSITIMEKEQNKGMSAIVDVFASGADDLMDDVKENFCDLFYLDGNLAANRKLPHGIESCLGTASSVTTYADGTAAGTSIGVTDNAALPDDIYAGLHTRPRYYGGTWTGTWPSGSGPAHCDFYAPTLVNWSSQGWVGAGSVTWPLTCEKALRRGIIWSQRNKSKDGKLNMVVMDEAMFYGLATAFAAKESLKVQRNEGVSLVSLGFTDVLVLDGVECTYEFGVPANIAYGFNVQQMGVRALESNVFMPDGPEWDIASQAWRWAVRFLGNFWFRPRYFAKWKNYA